MKWLATVSTGIGNMEGRRVAKRLELRAIVVGAGIVGAAIAFRLAEAGASVTVVDRAFPGAGTSGATFSWLNSFNKPPLEYHRLNVLGIAEHRVIAEEIGSQDCLHLDGGLMWEYAEPEAEVAQRTDNDEPTAGDAGRYVDLTTELARGGLAAKIESCRVLGYAIDEITVADAQKLEPDLVVDPSRVRAVYLMPGDGWVESRGLAHRLCTAAARRYGAKLALGEEVQSVSCHTGESPVVELRDGRTLGADVVINAAGADAGILASRSGVELTIERSLGVSFVSGSAPSQLRHVVHAPGTTLRPDAATRVMIRVEGMDAELVEGQVWSPSDRRCDEVIARASQVMPNLRYVGIESVRVGIRPVPSDGISVVGVDPRAPGLYHVVTHSGATLAPALARLVCADLSGLPVPELESFRLDRLRETRSRGAVSIGEPG